MLGSLAKTALTFAMFLFCTAAFAAGNSGITYQGRILKPDGSPLAGANVQFRLQIRTPNANNCLMYEEVQAQDMRNSGGVFSLTINDGSGSRMDSTGLGLDRIFANRGAFTFSSSTCQSGTTYTPTDGDGRNLVVLFKDETMSTWEPIPAAKINYVPYAFSSQAVQGFGADSLLRFVDGSGDPLTGIAPLSNAQYTSLMALVNGSSSVYSKAGELRGSAVPALTAGEVLGWNGTAWVSQSVVGGANSVTNTMIQDNSITGGKLDPAISISTSGTVASAITTTRDFKIYAASPSTFYVGMAAPALTGSYTLTWPMNAGTSGQVLTTNGSGVLTWTTPSSAGITALTGDVTATGPGSAAATVAAVGGVSAANVATGANAANAAVSTNTVSTIVKRDGTGGFSAGAVSVGSTVYRDSGSNTVTVQAPSAVTSSYVLKWPAAAGSASQVLTTDASGNLSWSTPLSSSTGFVQGGNTFGAGAVLGTNDNFDLRLRTNGATAMTILPSGSVGIGTTAPVTALDVVGAVTVSAHINASGMMTASRYEVGSNTTAPVSGMFRRNSNTLSFSTGSTERITIDSSGNVGIGTTSPTFPLDVDGNAHVGGPVNIGKIGQPGQIYLARSTDGVYNANVLFANGNDVRWTNSSGAGYYTWYTNNGAIAERMRLDNAGNVGIGTSAPGTKLDVAGSLRLGDGGETCAAGIAGGVRYNGGNIQFCNGTSWSTLGVAGAGITALTGDVTATGTGSVAATVANVGGVTAANVASGANLANAATSLNTASTIVRRDASGNFVAGNATLDGLKLNNAGSIFTMVNPVGGAWTMTLPATAGSNGQVMQTNGSGVMTWMTPLTSSSGFVNGGNSFGANSSLGNNDNFDLNIKTNNLNRVTVTAAGNVGIGTTAPNEKLRISGGDVRVDSTNSYVIDTKGGVYPATGVGVSLASTGYVSMGTGTGSPERMRIDSAGKVGIGTTAPNGALDVKGSLVMSGATSGYTGFQPAAAAGSTVWTLPAADGTSGQVLSTNGAGILSWTAAGSGSQWTTQAPGINYTAGYVGIGTTSPTSSLHVLSSTNYVAGQFDSTTDSAINIRAPANSRQAIQFESYGDGVMSILKTGTGTGAQLMVTDTSNINTFNSLLTINKTGNIGIGTTSPTARLQVEGSLKAQSANISSMYISPAASVYNVEVYPQVIRGAGSAYNTYGIASAPSVTMTGTQTGEVVAVSGIAQSNSVGGTQALLIGVKGVTTAAGSTTNTVTKSVGLYGSVDVSSQTTGTSAMSVLAASNTAGGAGGTITSNYGIYIEPQTAGSKNWQLYSAGTSPSYFAGGVGIGTTSPSGKLDVKGSIVMSGATSGYTGFQPAAAAGSTIWTLPSSDGTSGQVLSTNGSGVLSWAAAGTASQWTTQAPGINYMGGRVGIGTTSASTLFEIVSAVGNTTDLLSIKANAADGGAAFRVTRYGLPMMNNSVWGYDPVVGDAAYSSLYDTNITSGNGVAGNYNINMIPKGTGGVGVGTTAPNGKLDVKGSIVMSGATSGYAGFKVPAAAGSTVWTLPAADGTSGQLLSTNGAGILSWVAAGGTGDFKADGSVTMTGPLKLADGTAAAPSITIGSDPDTGFYSYAGNAIGVATGGVVRYRFTNGSFVSETGGSFSVSNGFSATNPTYSFVNDNDTGLFRATADTIGFTTGGVERQRIDASGNVGIGTTSPNGKLDVKGSIVMSGATSGYTGFQPAAAAGSTIWTLPAADGTSNQVLTTNGSGVLSWSTPSGGGITALTGDVTASGAGSVAATVAQVGGYSAANVAAGATVANAATAANTNNAIVKRDGVGSFAANIGTFNGVALNNAGSVVNLVNPIGAAYTLTLPTGTGTSGQVLSTNGSGVTSWVNAATGSQWTTQAPGINYMGGNVGIGTTSPVYRLDVQNSTASAVLNIETTSATASHSSRVRVAKGSNALNVTAYPTVYTPDYDYDRGGSVSMEAVGAEGLAVVASNAAGPLRFYTGGTAAANNRMMITASGNVGIGTTSPAYKLDVAGDINVTGNFKVNGVNLTAGGGDFMKNGSVAMTGDINTGTNHNVNFTRATGGQTPGLSWTMSDLSMRYWMTASSDGYTVNLGNENGNDQIQNWGTYGSTIQSTNNTTGTISNAFVLSSRTNLDMVDGFGGSLKFKLQDTGANNEIAGINYYRDGSDTSGALGFLTKNSGTMGTAMTIKPSGKIGIGTTSPQTKLDVVGDIGLGAWGTIGGGSGYGCSGCAANNSITLYNNTRASMDFNSQGYGGLQSGFTFSTGGTERLRIAEDGNVGIGTSSPGYLVHIAKNGGGLASLLRIEEFGATGDAAATFRVNNSNSFTLGVDNTDDTFKIANGQTLGSSDLMTIAPTGEVGIGTTSPSQKLEVNGTVLASAYLYSSDRRLKKDITPIEHSLEKLLTLSTVKFNWITPKNKDEERTQIGLIAQDVQKVFPEAVKEDSQGWLRMNYQALISPIIDGMREMYRQVLGIDARTKALEVEIARVKAENAQMKAEHKKLESRLDEIEKNLARKPASSTKR